MTGTPPQVRRREAGLRPAAEAPPKAVFLELEEVGLAEGAGAQHLEPCMGDVEVPQGPSGSLWASGPCLGRVVSSCA